MMCRCGSEIIVAQSGHSICERAGKELMLAWKKATIKAANKLNKDLVVDYDIPNPVKEK